MELFRVSLISSPSENEISGSDLPQLAVFAAPAVVPGALRSFSVNLGLATDTQSHAGDRAAARLGNLSAAFRTVAQALSFRQLASRTRDGVFHAGIDLILDCPVFCPATRHVQAPARLELQPKYTSSLLSPVLKEKVADAEMS
jgi:hypothetical protein